jgi:hypothetical protein
MINYLMIIASFVEKYIMEIAVVTLAILYATEIISVKSKRRERLLK